MVRRFTPGTFAASLAFRPVFCTSLRAFATMSSDHLTGGPRRWPRFLAAARPARVRSRIRSRSNWAMKPRMLSTSLPVLPLVESPYTRVDAAVAAVVMVWPVIDPLQRFHHAKRLKAAGGKYPQQID